MLGLGPGAGRLLLTRELPYSLVFKHDGRLFAAQGQKVDGQVAIEIRRSDSDDRFGVGDPRLRGDVRERPVTAVLPEL